MLCVCQKFSQIMFIQRHQASVDVTSMDRMSRDDFPASVRLHAEGDMMYHNFSCLQIMSISSVPDSEINNLVLT